MKSEDIAENLMQYFHFSEQVETAVAIGVNVKDGVCLSAGGVVMQLLPGTHAENMDRAENAMQNFVDMKGVIQKLGADGIMDTVFKRDTVRGVYKSYPEYMCNCSRAKLERVILSLGKAECEQIIAEQGCIKAHCHYCNSDYIFDEKDVEKLFG